MAYKDILVHLDGGDRDSVCLDLGLGLARRFAGRLTGLFGRSERFAPGVVARRPSDGFEVVATRSEQQFTQAAADAGVPSRWWRLAHGEAGHVVSETVICARFADLVVMGQHHDGKDAPEDLAEHVILQSGRPVLVVPAVGDYPTVGTNVLAAWNGGREAARALHDALPFLQGAARVEVLTVGGARPGAGDGAVPPVNVIDHLGVHGVTVVREVLAGEDIGVMDLILSRAFDQGADLLVMGAHGGYHLPFLRGAGTRHILGHMTLPVLMGN